MTWKHVAIIALGVGLAAVGAIYHTDGVNVIACSIISGALGNAGHPQNAQPHLKLVPMPTEKAQG